MKQDSAKQIKLGMILSYINLGIGNLIPFFYTPIMLELLGQSEYGLYKIASSTTSYLSLMAFGIGSAVSRFIIKARTQEGKEAEERMFGLFNLLFQGIALLTLIVGGLITWKLDLLYGASLTVAELSRMRILVGLMVINTAVSFSATSYNAVVSSHERFLFIHSINVISTIGTPVMNLVVLFLGYRSVGMAVISLMLNVLVRLIYIAYVRKTLDLKPRYQNLPHNALREIFAFSFWVFVGSIAGQLYDATDTVIIGTMPALATTGAAIYNIGLTFPHIISSIGQVVPGLFMPTINKMVFANATNTQLTELVIKIGRLQSYLAGLIVSGFIAFGQPFIHFYAGHGYELSYWVAVIILIPNCVPLIQSVALSILRAKNLHQFRSILYLFMALVNIVFTLLLVGKYGLIGACLPTSLALLVGNGIIMNLYYWKKVGLDIPLFWRNVTPIFVVSALLCGIAVAMSFVIDFNNIYTLLSGIVIYTVVFCSISWLVLMNSFEKNTVTKFLRKANKS